MLVKINQNLGADYTQKEIDAYNLNRYGTTDQAYIDTLTAQAEADAIERKRLRHLELYGNNDKSHIAAVFNMRNHRRYPNTLEITPTIKKIIVDTNSTAMVAARYWQKINPSKLNEYLGTNDPDIINAVLEIGNRKSFPKGIPLTPTTLDSINIYGAFGMEPDQYWGKYLPSKLSEGVDDRIYTIGPIPTREPEIFPSQPTEPVEIVTTTYTPTTPGETVTTVPVTTQPTVIPSAPTTTVVVAPVTTEAEKTLTAAEIAAKMGLVEGEDILNKKYGALKGWQWGAIAGGVLLLMNMGSK